MWGKTAKGAVGMLGAAALAVTGLVSPSGAQEEEVDTSTNYLVDATGHPFEPYVTFPEEVVTGAPSTFVELQKDPIPVRCESISSLVTFGVLVDGIVAIIVNDNTGGYDYQNPTTAWSLNPKDNREEEAEIATFPGGPRAHSKCPTTTEGEGTGAFGAYSQGEQFSISGGKSFSKAKKLAEDTIVSETTNTVFGLKIADLRINFIESYLKVTSKIGEIPTADFRIEFGGMRVGEQGGSFGEGGFVIAGNDVVGAEMIDEFNTQANGYEKEFEMIGKYGLRIVSPEFGLSRSGRFIYELVAVDGLIGLAARQNAQVGDGFGFRMGVSRIASNYLRFGEAPPAAEVCEECQDPRIGV